MTIKRKQTAGPSNNSVPFVAVSRPANVFDLRMRILPRHIETLTRWLDAGRNMGLCDAAPYGREADAPGTGDYVLIWVRENADPAYMVAPEGMHWTITDAIRNQMLARVRTFEEALNLIRPVLQTAGRGNF